MFINNTIININLINKVIIVIVSFALIFGYYAILVVITNYGLHDTTRIVTIPVRIVGLSTAILFIILNYKYIVYPKTPFLLFYIFSFILLFNTLYYLYIYNADVPLYRKSYEYPFYYLAYVIIPFMFFSVINNKNYLNIVYYTIIISLFIISLFNIIFYAEILFLDVSRLHEAKYFGYDTVNPLIVSYCSAFLIGLCIYELINKTNYKIFYLLGIGVSVIPFVIGASRGSVVSIFFPIIILMIFRLNYKKNIIIIILSIILLYLVYQISNYYGTGIFTRMSSSFSDIRIEYWKETINQFIKNPLFGNYIEVISYKTYPHNIILEVFLITGIMGGVFFLVLLFATFYYSLNILRKYPKYGWISIMFYQSISYNMLSGTIYMAAWFWVSVALVVSAYYLFNKKIIINQ